MATYEISTPWGRTYEVTSPTEIEDYNLLYNYILENRDELDAQWELDNAENDPSWSEGRVAGFAGGVQRGVGSILEAVEETVAPLAVQGFTGGMAKPEKVDIFGTYDESLRAAEQENRKIQQASMPENKVGRFATEAVDAIAMMMPSVLATVGTGGSATLGYAIMSIPAFGEGYTEGLERSEGDHDAAAIDGVMAVAKEIGSEKLFGVLDNLGMSSGFGKAITSIMAREAGSEMTTEALDALDDYLRHGETRETEQLIYDILYAGVLGAVAGGVIGGVGHLPRHQRNKEDAEIEAALAEGTDRLASRVGDEALGAFGEVETTPVMERVQGPDEFTYEGKTFENLNLDRFGTTLEGDEALLPPTLEELNLSEHENLEDRRTRGHGEFIDRIRDSRAATRAQSYQAWEEVESEVANLPPDAVQSWTTMLDSMESLRAQEQEMFEEMDRLRSERQAEREEKYGSRRAGRFGYALNEEQAAEFEADLQEYNQTYYGNAYGEYGAQTREDAEREGWLPQFDEEVLSIQEDLQETTDTPVIPTVEAEQYLEEAYAYDSVLEDPENQALAVTLRENLAYLRKAAKYKERKKAAINKELDAELKELAPIAEELGEDYSREDLINEINAKRKQEGKKELLDTTRQDTQGWETIALSQDGRVIVQHTGPQGRVLVTWVVGVPNSVRPYFQKVGARRTWRPGHARKSGKAHAAGPHNQWGVPDILKAEIDASAKKVLGRGDINIDLKTESRLNKYKKTLLRSVRSRDRAHAEAVRKAVTAAIATNQALVASGRATPLTQADLSRIKREAIADLTADRAILRDSFKRSAPNMQRTTLIPGLDVDRGVKLYETYIDRNDLKKIKSGKAVSARVYQITEDAQMRILELRPMADFKGYGVFVESVGGLDVAEGKQWRDATGSVDLIPEAIIKANIASEIRENLEIDGGTPNQSIKDNLRKARKAPTQKKEDRAAEVRTLRKELAELKKKETKAKFDKPKAPVQDEEVKIKRPTKEEREITFPEKEKTFLLEYADRILKGTVDKKMLKERVEAMLPPGSTVDVDALVKDTKGGEDIIDSVRRHIEDAPRQELDTTKSLAEQQREAEDKVAADKAEFNKAKDRRLVKTLVDAIVPPGTDVDIDALVADAKTTEDIVNKLRNVGKETETSTTDRLPTPSERQTAINKWRKQYKLDDTSFAGRVWKYRTPEQRAEEIDRYDTTIERAQFELKRALQKRTISQQEFDAREAVIHASQKRARRMREIVGATIRRDNESIAFQEATEKRRLAEETRVIQALEEEIAREEAEVEARGIASEEQFEFVMYETDLNLTEEQKAVRKLEDMQAMLEPYDVRLGQVLPRRDSDTVAAVTETDVPTPSTPQDIKQTYDFNYSNLGGILNEVNAKEEAKRSAELREKIAVGIYGTFNATRDQVPSIFGITTEVKSSKKGTKKLAKELEALSTKNTKVEGSLDTGLSVEAQQEINEWVELGNLPSMPISKEIAKMAADMTVADALDMVRTNAMFGKSVKNTPKQEVPHEKVKTKPTQKDVEQDSTVLDVESTDPVARSTFSTAIAMKSYSLPFGISFRGSETIARFFHKLRPSMYGELYTLKQSIFGVETRGIQSIKDAFSKANKANRQIIRKQAKSMRSVVKDLSKLKGAINLHSHKMADNWKIARGILKVDGKYKQYDKTTEHALNSYLQGTSLADIEEAYGVRIPPRAVPYLDKMIFHINQVAAAGLQYGSWKKDSTRGSIVAGRAYLHMSANAKELTPDTVRYAVDEFIPLAKAAWDVPTTVEELNRLTPRELVSLINDTSHNLWAGKLGKRAADGGGTSRGELIYSFNGVEVVLGKYHGENKIRMKDVKAQLKEAAKDPTGQQTAALINKLRAIVRSNLPTNDDVYRIALSNIVQGVTAQRRKGSDRGMGAIKSLSKTRDVLLSDHDKVEAALSKLGALDKDARTYIKDNRERLGTRAYPLFLQEMQDNFPNLTDRINMLRSEDALNSRMRIVMNELTDTQSLLGRTIGGIAQTVYSSKYLLDHYTMGKANGWAGIADSGDVIDPSWVPLAQKGTALGDTTFVLPNGVFKTGADLRVPNTVANVIREEFRTDAVDEHASRGMFRTGASLVKYWLVVWNPLALVRNAGSTGMLHAAASAGGIGTVRAHRVALDTARAEFTRSFGERIEEREATNRKYSTNLVMEDMIGRGIKFDGAKSGALYDLQRSGLQSDDDTNPIESSSNKVMRSLRKGGARVKGVFDETFRLGDEAVKVAGYLQFAAEYLAITGKESTLGVGEKTSKHLLDKWLDGDTLTAKEKVTLEETLEWAAESVMQRYPTFSRAAPMIKLLSKSPVFGAFPTFPYEVMRSSANNVLYSASLAYGSVTGTMFDGTKVNNRAVGMMTAGLRLSTQGALWGAGMYFSSVAARGVMDWLGWDDPEEEKASMLGGVSEVAHTTYQAKTRGLLPSYMRGGLATVSRIAEDAQSYFVTDIGYAVPTGSILEAVMRANESLAKAMRTGDHNVISATALAVKETISSLFLQDEVLVGAFLKRMDITDPTSYQDERWLKKMGDNIQRWIVQGDIKSPAIEEASTSRRALGAIAGTLVNHNPLAESLAQAEKLGLWLLENMSDEEAADPKTDTFIRGLFHAAGYKERQITTDDWARSFKRDATNMQTATDRMLKALTKAEYKDYDEFKATFDAYNSMRRDHFNTLHNSIQGMKHVVGTSNEDIVKVLRKVNVKTRAGNHDLNHIAAGYYYAPDVQAFLDRLNSSYNSEATTAVSKEEGIQKYNWYIQARQEAGVNKDDY